MQQTSLEQLRRFAEGGYLYAILDACDAPAVPEKARELGESAAVSLFKGSAQEDYSAVAPNLFKVSPETLDWIVATLWNQPWGVFVVSKADLESLRVHFRRFLLVQLPDGERWFFRYYDPRILKVYLSKCNERELHIFFGPVRAYALGGAQVKNAWIFHAPPVAVSDSATNASIPLPWEIRPEQYAAFEADAQAEWRRELLEHIKQFAPRHCQVMGGTSIANIVELGIARAQRCGFTKPGPVRLFVEMMFMLGSDFDSDPQYSFAAEALRGSQASEDERASRLYQSLLVYLDKVAGPEHQYAIDGLRRAAAVKLSDVVRGTGMLEDAVARELIRIYPQKCEFLGGPTLRQIIQEGFASAGRWGINTPEGLALFAGLSFALGHRFDADPLLPWIGSILSNARFRDPQQRVERLYSKTMVYLNEAFQHLGA
ncbi:MAG: DUF4123 domain-containing protein [Terriglobales bacterium]